VLQNEWMKDIRHLPDILLNSAWAFRENQPPINYYRPVMHLTYMVDYHLFGLQPWGFHLTNAILHTLNTALVFLIASALFRKHGASTAGQRGAWQNTLHYYLSPPLAAAIIFAIHPVNTEAVAWVAAIPELTFVFFSLCSFYLYITTPSFPARYILAPFFFLLATLSKETALTLPILLFAYDAAFNKKGGKMGLHYFRRYLPFIVAAGIYFALRLYALGGLAPQKPKHDYLTTFQYLLNVFPLTIEYFKTLLFPVNLTVFHVFHPVFSIMEGKALASIFLIATFFMLLYVLKRKSPLALFALLWIVIPLLPVLYIPGVGVYTLAERYLYLPSVGFGIFFAYTLTRIVKTLLSRDRKGMVTLLTIFLFVTIIFYAASTVKRNVTWKNEFTLWSDTVKKSPDSAIARYNLGIALFNRGLPDSAIAELKEAVRILPVYADAHYNLGAVYQDRGLFQDAVNEYMMVLQLSPGSVDAFYNLGLIYTETGFFYKAERAFLEAVKLKPDYTEAHSQLKQVRLLMNLQR
jgi:hypothetical protein